MKLTKLLFAALIIFTSTSIFAQDTETDSHNVTITIPEVALLDLETDTSKTVTLAGTHSNEAGDPINFDNATDDSIWLNYSSIVSSGKKRNVSVEITDGKVPGGLQLNVEASSSATGVGTLGTPAGSIKLSGKAQDLITGVGSSYTETGNEKGHKLTYTLSQNGSYGDLTHNVSGTILEITYTLTDD